MAKIIDVEGIGEVYSQRLIEAGIVTTNALLRKGATPEGRKAITEKTGISPKLILEWVSNADLYRIRGVGSEYSDLLEEAGVDTVPELARRNPQNLYRQMQEVNQSKALVRRLPVFTQVEDWIAQARGLPRVISHESGSAFMSGDPTTDAPAPIPDPDEI